MCRQNRSDREDTRERRNDAFTVLAQRFRAWSPLGRHFDGKAHMTVAHDQSLNEAGVDEVFSAYRIHDTGKRAKYVFAIHRRHTPITFQVRPTRNAAHRHHAMLRCA
jgi:hypothetical protein